MSYHFPNERRRVERQAAPAAAHTGRERRMARSSPTEVKLVRKPEPMNRGVLWAAVIMVMIVADNVFLDGGYRHMLTGWFDDRVIGLRHWSANLWD